MKGNLCVSYRYMLNEKKVEERVCVCSLPVRNDEPGVYLSNGVFPVRCLFCNSYL